MRRHAIKFYTDITMDRHGVIIEAATCSSFASVTEESGWKRCSDRPDVAENGLHLVSTYGEIESLTEPLAVDGVAARVVTPHSAQTMVAYPLPFPLVQPPTAVLATQGASVTQPRVGEKYIWLEAVFNNVRVSPADGDTRSSGSQTFWLYEEEWDDRVRRKYSD